MTDIRDTLNERAKTHGPFEEQAYLIHETIRVWRGSRNWDRLSDVQLEALHMLLHKVGRVLVGVPEHLDHWHDMVGYVQLVVDYLTPAGRPPVEPISTAFVMPTAPKGTIATNAPSGPGTPEDGGHYERQKSDGFENAMKALNASPDIPPVRPRLKLGKGNFVDIGNAESD